MTAPADRAATVLIVDDEISTLTVLEHGFLKGMPEIRLLTAADGAAALDCLRGQEVDVLVTDLVLPGLDGKGLMEMAKAIKPGLPVLIMSAHGTIERALELIRAGARDFITKPFKIDDVLERVARSLDTVRLQRDIHRTREIIAQAPGQGPILFASEVMQAMIKRAHLVARSSVPVLITGESGTGKELFARELHEHGSRRDEAFIAVNCGAFTESLLEAELFGHERGAFTGADRASAGIIKESDGGTLFLDEIGETSTTFQVKLLRFLQEGEIRPVGKGRPYKVDTRIVAATNKDLVEMMAEGSFREDLYYRLNVVPMVLPPLRDRPEDILLLAQHFLRTYGQEMGRDLLLSPQACQRLLDYPWPGNVRELENKIRQLAILAPTDLVAAEHLDLGAGRPQTVFSSLSQELHLAPGMPFKEAKKAAIDRFERVYVEGLMQRNGGAPSRAAEEAGMDRKALWRLMKKHGISADRFKDGATPGRGTP